jgi:hypothetical protein
MREIDVHDLPEPVAKAIEAMVQSIRNQSKGNGNGRGTAKPVELPKWSGNVMGALRRAEIYDGE